ncbi:hypothetical protein VSR01_16525 [Actinacidiphila sp. DG2A-62]|uniref:hypothetical protein n=1 Tax=Actinacidiphila sp. DG2A-62 TaxID=3108821 RepID=UPI002DBC81C3|nr:hypothetical protein [Actinacidiphila sp. DG2A-62]MEC3995052.1 hypothetical protein [Actinacidiphila sp. DG2A-62]
MTSLNRTERTMNHPRLLAPAALALAAVLALAGCSASTKHTHSHSHGTPVCAHVSHYRTGGAYVPAGYRPCILTTPAPTRRPVPRRTTPTPAAGHAAPTSRPNWTKTPAPAATAPKAPTKTPAKTAHSLVKVAPAPKAAAPPKTSTKSSSSKRH